MVVVVFGLLVCFDVVVVVVDVVGVVIVVVIVVVDVVVVSEQLSFFCGAGALGLRVKVWFQIKSRVFFQGVFGGLRCRV
jgi:hypothetical protein